MVPVADRRVVSLDEVGQLGAAELGGKAATLAMLEEQGFPVAPGAVVRARAYRELAHAGPLEAFIRMEIERKPQKESRWEELWDAALRIRSRFVSTALPQALEDEILAAVERLPAGEAGFAVRSSSSDEDGSIHSFAGLHESVLGVSGHDALLTAVKQVWASTWSDAALLYRDELGLDPGLSAMAVLIQPMVVGLVSGVAFSRDPRHQEREQMIIEAVRGACSALVDGSVAPSRWSLVKAGRVQSHDGDDLLDTQQLRRLQDLVAALEASVGAPVDVEWTLSDSGFTVLQARPITTGRELPADRRRYYLTLRPSRGELAELCARVVDQLIPELTGLGEELSSEPIEDFDDQALAEAIESRRRHLERWRSIYETDFIPFAHGVRSFGVIYNDLMQPTDPFEFVELLRGESFLAGQRNRALSELAESLRSQPRLLHAVEAWVSEDSDSATLREELANIEGGHELTGELAAILPRYFDVRYGEERWIGEPGWVFALILELARSQRSVAGGDDGRRGQLESALLRAAGEDSEDVAEALRVARLSWRLRDDDNLLIGRLESQLLRAVELGILRLTPRGLDGGVRSREGYAEAVASRLRGESNTPIEAINPRQEPTAGTSRLRLRQLVGQPASPGFASGPARWIRSPRDVARFRAGEVIVCDAIEPGMTMVVPLAAAIVERRGGMLIHGAIIARELGIPCVNGVGGRFDRIPEGEMVAVDGYTGLVTIGEAELDRETGS
ncbi:MAG: hypothetical protein KJO07_22900 [Deltaproteobacteria bacterium]|nr:hypothetical protein [Deltaproteobacteria bacterium]